MPNNEPLASVIISACSNGSALESCIENAIAQSAGLDAEIIVVDGASATGADRICAATAKAHPNIALSHHAAPGLAAARNRGIEAARGRYLLFLDAGDELDPNGLRGIVLALDRLKNDVDLVTCQIALVNSRTGNATGHRRQQWLEKTGVYNLSDYPHLCQTTLNVCVKRKAALKHPFPANCDLGSEQLFITDILAEKAAIGYYHDTTLNRTVDGFDNTSADNKPLLVFDQMIELYSGLLGIGRSNEAMQEYCREMVLYDFSRRLGSDSLFPNFGSPEERELNFARLAEIACSIPVKSYFDSRYLRAAHKSFLVKRFDLVPADLRIKYSKGKVRVYQDETLLWKTRAPQIRIARCTIAGNTLSLMGILESHALVLDDREVRLFLKTNDVMEPVELVRSAYEYMACHEKSIRAWRFEKAIQLDNASTTLSFRLELAGEKVTMGPIVQHFLRCNARIDKNEPVRYFRNYTLKVVNDKSICITPVKQIGAFHSLVRSLRTNLDTRQGKLRRRTLRLEKELDGRRIWLYSDLPTSPMKNNALMQLLHDIGKDDGVLRYYVTEHVEELEKEYPETAGHLLMRRSDEHVCHYLLADTILASYLDPPTFTPCARGVYDCLGDLAKAKRMIYLQHGVLHAHMPWYFSYDKTLFDYEVVSSQFEIDNLATNYYFSPDKLVASGAPRFDALNCKPAHSRTIIYAPSWRSHLIAGDENQRIALGDRFLESQFYKGLANLTQAISSSGILQKHDFEMQLKLHPNLSAYASHIPLGDDGRITMAPATVDEGSFAIMITDYSSYLYDFLYSGCKILYYLPDRREFEGGLNHYSKLDLPFDEAFGPVTENADEAVALLDSMMAQFGEDGRWPAADQYSKRADGFFLHRDNANAERLYNALMKQ